MWFPSGQVLAESVPPGLAHAAVLMAGLVGTAAALHASLRLLWPALSVMQVCAAVLPLLAAFATTAMYFFVAEFQVGIVGGHGGVECVGTIA